MTLRYEGTSQQIFRLKTLSKQIKIASLALFVCGGLASTTAMADVDKSAVSSAEVLAEKTLSFAIAAQPLEAALIEFTRQSRAQVVLSAGVSAAGLNSTAVTGDFSPRQALNALLEDAGLVVKQASSGDFVVSAKEVMKPWVGEATTQLETVVVVGRATNSLISSDDLDRYQANGLADIFRVTPSVSVGGGANGIAQKIYVRGLEDVLLNVTVDGAPQASTLFNHIGRVTIDPNLLKEVDVQAGAGEATSGAGAIGGSIRFRTKDIDDLLSDDELFGGNIKASAFTNKGEQLAVSLYGRISDDWGLLGYISDIDRDNAEDGNGVEQAGSKAEQTLGFFKISGDITENQSLSLSYEKREQKGKVTLRPNYAPIEGEPLYDSTGERETIVGNYLFSKNDLLNIELSVYSTESSFERAETVEGTYIYRTDINSTGFDLRNTSVIGMHSFTYGIDFRDDEVDSGYRKFTDYSGREEGQVFGAYAQGHSQVTNKLLLSYGARYDDYEFNQKNTAYTDHQQLYSFDSSDISINAGLIYDITENWSLSLGYAEAARGKVVGDGYTVYGTTMDPNLDSESVTNTEASVEYAVENFNMKLAVYQSQIDDVIYDQTGEAVYFENIGTVETEGFEFDLTYRWNALEMYFGYSSSDTTLDPANGLFSVDYGKIDIEAYEYRILGNSRGDTVNLGLSFVVSDNLIIGWNMTYVDDLNNMEVLQRSVEIGRNGLAEVQSVDKSGYDVHDIYAEWVPFDSLQINFAVTNLFDKAYRNHSSIADYSAITGFESFKGYKDPGRNARLSLNYTF